MSAPRTVLVVDDDADVRSSLQEVLEDEGFVVTVAADGLEALRKLDAGLAPDVILLDLMMPVMDGLQFRSKQLSRPRLCSIPVVVLSAQSNVRDLHHQLRCAGALRKPVRLQELLDVLGRIGAGGSDSRRSAPPLRPEA